MSTHEERVFPVYREQTPQIEETATPLERLTSEERAVLCEAMNSQLGDSSAKDAHPLARGETKKLKSPDQ
jgi:hypothetical protein